MSLEKLRQRIKTLPVLGLWLEDAWRWATGRSNLTHRLLRSRSIPRDGLVMKIGANDASTGDPIAQLLLRLPGTRCVFVEPVPHLLERARLRWGAGERFRFVNAVVGDRKGICDFFFVDAAAAAGIALDFDPEQIGSLDRAHILKHDARLAPFVRTIQVPAVVLSELLVQHGVPDLLHIDAEGADWLILSQLDLCRFRPAHIIVEHIHLGDAEKQQLRERFTASYRIEQFGTDWLLTLQPLRSDHPHG